MILAETGFQSIKMCKTPRSEASFWSGGGGDKVADVLSGGIADVVDNHID
jgi:hypothetical protein